MHSKDKVLNRSTSSLPNSSPKHSADQFCSSFDKKFKTLCLKLLFLNLNLLFLSDKSPPIFLSFKLVSVDEVNLIK